MCSSVISLLLESCPLHYRRCAPLACYSNHFISCCFFVCYCWSSSDLTYELSNQQPMGRMAPVSFLLCKGEAKVWSFESKGRFAVFYNLITRKLVFRIAPPHNLAGDCKTLGRQWDGLRFLESCSGQVGEAIGAALSLLTRQSGFAR